MLLSYRDPSARQLKSPGLLSDSEEQAAQLEYTSLHPYVLLQSSDCHQYERTNKTPSEVDLAQQWSHVMFSDDSRFTLDFNDGSQRIWHHRGKHYLMQQQLLTVMDMAECNRLEVEPQ